MLTKQFIQVQNFVAEKAREERGEMSSTLVLSAGLVAAAMAAKDPIGQVISNFVGNVETGTVAS